MYRKRDSFQELYKRLSPRLRFIARHNSNGSVFTKEEDLYQEMCLYLWDRYPRGRTPGVNDSYIAKGCEFYIRNYIRKNKEKARLSSLEEPVNSAGCTLKEVIPAKEECSADKMEGRMVVDRILNNSFSPKEKMALLLLLQGYTTREAGRQMGISHVMVSKLKKNIVAKYKTKLPRKA